MSWTHSESIDLLAAALAKAQAGIKGAVKDSANPFFKSTYADLASVWDACRPQLTAHGLSVVQLPVTPIYVSDTTGVVGEGIGLTTVLLHESGQWIASTYTVTPKDNGSQAVGSCLTYMRRYALSAFVGVPQIDDDGEAAEARDKPVHKPKPKPVPATTSGMTPVGAITPPPVSREPGDEDDIDAAMPDSPGLMAENVTPTNIREAKGQGWEARFITFSNKQEAGLFLNENDAVATEILQMIYESHQSGKPLAVQFERSKKDAKKLKIVSVLWQEDFVQ